MGIDWVLLAGINYLTCNTAECEYETGAFDISAGSARPTALAGLIKDLAQGKSPDSNYSSNRMVETETAGFYQGKTEVTHHSTISFCSTHSYHRKNQAPWEMHLQIYVQRNLRHVSVGAERKQIFAIQSKLEDMINRYHPWAIINATGYVKVDDAEDNKDECYGVNYLGPQKLAILCEHIKLNWLLFLPTWYLMEINLSLTTRTICLQRSMYMGIVKMLAEAFLCAGKSIFTRGTHERLFWPLGQI